MDKIRNGKFRNGKFRGRQKLGFESDSNRYMFCRLNFYIVIFFWLLYASQVVIVFRVLIFFLLFDFVYVLFFVFSLKNSVLPNLFRFFFI